MHYLKRRLLNAQRLSANERRQRISDGLRRSWARRKRRKHMHYRNGREAKNGDKIVKLDESGRVVSFGVLHGAVPGNDYCNGNIAVIQPANDFACMVDCLHVDDVAAILAANALDKRPAPAAS